ncbi:RluA family pseudouridine synthase [Oribacterium sp. oral taxon 108]|uniref:RluA family pseudouridine synthase n=1 Tax=Oribacterium sp. oral taxon 108 TaxID=712414 RepID=UPI00020DD949|nr:RluA family pseudouridine synthase [Oribacterium sp. oral taxon 108]EGL36415.1 pseudouridine synthase, RluA family [Oribacterium sp. oral taxon 108 str. F0425]
MVFIVEDVDAGKRLDSFLAEKNTAKYTRSFIGKMIEENLVLYNGKPSKASTKIKTGDRIELFEKEPEPLAVKGEEIPLEIVYEDDDLMVINKPRGMVVHPAPGHTSGTLVNAVLSHAGESLSSINGVLRPGIVHRIDKDTSGLILVCKNDFSHKALAKQLEEHSITRRYHAICSGRLKEEQGTVSAPIGRDEKNRKQQAINYKHGKEAITHYRLLENLQNASLLECRLETGRTHQIRVHMKSIGHPLLGDPLYGPKKNLYAIKGQALHAMVLGFVHPRSEEYMEFSADYPEDFQKLLNKLRISR